MPRVASQPESAFLWYWRHIARGPEPALEYRFAVERRWRFDVAWPEARVAVEIDGGGWVRGRHHRPAGYQADAEKLNAAVAAGWRVLRFTPEMLRRDPARAAELVAELLQARRPHAKRPA